MENLEQPFLFAPVFDYIFLISLPCFTGGKGRFFKVGELKKFLPLCDVRINLAKFLCDTCYSVVAANRIASVSNAIVYAWLT